jgi:predicted O-methyltransferase YrrM
LDAKLRTVLDRLELEMEREDGLRATLPAAEWQARRKDLMLAIGPEAGRFLNLLVKAASAQRVLELGTSAGYSTLWLADAVRETGGGVVTLDRNASKHAQAARNLAEAGLARYVELLTAEAAAGIRTLSGPFDFVLLDADRSAYVACFQAFSPLLRPGGLAVADNMAFPNAAETQPYRDAVRGHRDYESVAVPIGNGLELSRKLR